MSETVVFVGKLKPVKMRGDIEKTAEAIFKESFGEKDDIFRTYLEALQEETRDYCTVGNRLYCVQIENDDPYESVFRASSNGDGTIDFVVKYHNGGCSFEEAIENAVEGGI
jgi:hypothetical protein